jgi:hypothetical protein
LRVDLDENNYSRPPHQGLGKKANMIILLAVLAGIGHIGWVISTLLDNQSAVLVKETETAQTA